MLQVVNNLGAYSYITKCVDLCVEQICVIYWGERWWGWLKFFTAMYMCVERCFSGTSVLYQDQMFITQSLDLDIYRSQSMTISMTEQGERKNCFYVRPPVLV